MDYRQLDRLDDADRNQVYAAIDEILADINDASSRPFYEKTIALWFGQVDGLRLSLSSRGDRHIPRIQRLIVEGCESDPEAIDLSGGERLTPHERTIYNALSAAGCIVLRNGWPDFLVIHRETGRVFGVEAKGGSSRVRQDQKVVHSILRKAGVPVVVARNPKTIMRQLNRGAQPQSGRCSPSTSARKP